MSGEYEIRGDGERLLYSPPGEAGRTIAAVDATYTATSHIYEWGLLAGTSVTATAIEPAEGTTPRLRIENGDGRWVPAGKWRRLREAGVIERIDRGDRPS